MRYKLYILSRYSALTANPCLYILSFYGLGSKIGPEWPLEWDRQSRRATYTPDSTDSDEFYIVESVGFIREGRRRNGKDDRRLSICLIKVWVFHIYHRTTEPSLDDRSSPLKPKLRSRIWYEQNDNHPPSSLPDRHKKIVYFFSLL